MTFQDAEKTYKDLRSAHAAGNMTDADFELQVNQLKVQDAQGRWWQLGVRTGEWYYNDGQKWVKGKPPVTSTPPPTPASAAAAETPAATAAPTTTTAPAPPPTVAAAPAAAPTAPKETSDRASVMPRGLFAPKPEGGNGGGLSRPVLIGIIAAAAVIAIALCVGGYYLLTGGILGGGTARATSTLPTNPTQVVIVVPTLAATPTSAATSTPAPTDTLVVGLTNTPPPGSRATNTRAPGAARTATPTRASASVTPAPPPGLYVTKIAIDRTIEANQKFGFRVTFFNNSGGSGHKDKWLVVVYRKKDLVEGSPERPFGNTPTKTLDVPVGTTEVLLAESYALGPSGPPDCYYQAEANYVGDNNLLVPFPSTGGKPIRFEFSFCQ